MQQINISHLTHPTMVAKIRLAMQLAAYGRGHEMNGHATRCYIQNRHGRNIMRLDYRDNTFVVYGNEAVVITEVVKAALSKVQS